jgi:hypothetical protein
MPASQALPSAAPPSGVSWVRWRSTAWRCRANLGAFWAASGPIPTVACSRRHRRCRHPRGPWVHVAAGPAPGAGTLDGHALQRGGGAECRNGTSLPPPLHSSCRPLGHDDRRRLLWSNRSGHWDTRGMILPGGVPVWQRNVRRRRQSSSRKPSASLQTTATAWQKLRGTWALTPTCSAGGNKNMPGIRRPPFPAMAASPPSRQNSARSGRRINGSRWRVPL